MMITTTTEIKHVENSFEILNEFGIEIDLKGILVEEFEQKLPNDIICTL